MVRHHRAQGWYGEEVDPAGQLEELERTLLETLAEVELARRGVVSPWEAERRGRHARPSSEGHTGSTESAG